jgi:hypothetical protein
MENMGTFLNETIHITPRCAIHLDGHQNKMVPFMKPSILAILAIALCSTTGLVGQLMILETIISYIRLITTTPTTKT